MQKEEKQENPTVEKEQSPIITHTSAATTTITTNSTTTTANAIETIAIATVTSANNLIEKDQDIPVDFSSLTLQDNIVENT